MMKADRRTGLFRFSPLFQGPAFQENGKRRSLTGTVRTETLETIPVGMFFKIAKEA